MHRSLRLLLGSGVLATALLTTAVPAQAYATPVVLSAGHVDVVDVAYEDGALEIGVHDETVEPDVEREVDDVVLLVKRAARTTVPDSTAFGFLGAPGARVWVLPEIQNEELLWPGLSAEEIEAGVFTGDTVTARVEGVAGPGRVAVWTEDAVGTPHILVNSGDGLPDAFPLAAGAHQHASWGFQKAGTYLIKVRATGTLAATGATVTSEPAVYRIVVQP
ncbi:choice-of-anchor M domain-containing protein [Paractinoplanes deccanensis]|uniref:choice-of-anchor M domain-containing protein n=1 Tax=Paractinoplanes deccanensis TaxID=113561 RepID=UPI001943B60E|nr:choice-of-anchor M domain-containing protein [Actinoplanes deccanensis]